MTDLDIERIEGEFYAVVMPDLEMFEFPVVKIDGEPAIYRDEEDALERCDGLSEKQGDQFAVVRLDVTACEPDDGA